MLSVVFTVTIAYTHLVIFGSITLGRSLIYLQAGSTNNSAEDISAAVTTNYETTNKAYRKMKAPNEKYKS
jgi:hypothetical protein